MLNEQKLKVAFEKTAGRYDRYALFAKDIADELVDRFQYFKLKPTLIVDVGAGTGYVAQAFRRRYKKMAKAQFVNVDYSMARLRWARKYKRWFAKDAYVCADAYRLPFKSNSVDCLFSNLCLPFVNDMQAIFLEWQRVLKPEGVCLFSSFGPDTLTELRQAFLQVDDQPHVHVFYDMHDVGDALMKAGFIDPVMDVNVEKLTYPSLNHLLKSLQGLGVSNALSDRNKGLMPTGQLRKLKAAYPSPCMATVEVIYGQAFGADFLNNQIHDGQIHVPFEMLKIKR